MSRNASLTHAASENVIGNVMNHDCANVLNTCGNRASESSYYVVTDDLFIVEKLCRQSSAVMSTVKSTLLNTNLNIC